MIFNGVIDRRVLNRAEFHLRVEDEGGLPGTLRPVAVLARGFACGFGGFAGGFACGLMGGPLGAKIAERAAGESSLRKRPGSAARRGVNCSAA